MQQQVFQPENVIRKAEQRLPETGPLILARGAVSCVGEYPDRGKYYGNSRNCSNQKRLGVLPIIRNLLQNCSQNYKKRRVLSHYPYDYIKVQTLFPENFQRRNDFCNWLLGIVAENIRYVCIKSFVDRLCNFFQRWSI